MANAARTAKMVENVAKTEIDNSEDPQFREELGAAKERVTQGEGEKEGGRERGREERKRGERRERRVGGREQ